LIIHAKFQALLPKKKPVQFREYQDSQFRKTLAQLHRSFETSHLRHAQVRQYQVRREAFRQAQYAQTVASRSDDFKLPLKVEVRANRMERSLRIIGNDHANFPSATFQPKLLPDTECSIYE
jgi:hypothetical protein